MSSKDNAAIHQLFERLECRYALRVLWALRDAAELVYWLGQRPACRIVRQGRIHTPSGASR